jgi:hypothetical protein
MGRIAGSYAPTPCERGHDRHVHCRTWSTSRKGETTDAELSSLDGAKSQLGAVPFTPRDFALPADFARTRAAGRDGSRHFGGASSHRAMLAPVAVSAPVSAPDMHKHLYLERRRRLRRRRRWRRGKPWIRDHIVPPLHRLLRLWASGRVQCQHLAAATTIAFAMCGHRLRRYLLV